MSISKETKKTEGFSYWILAVIVGSLFIGTVLLGEGQWSDADVEEYVVTKTMVKTTADKEVEAGMTMLEVYNVLGCPKQVICTDLNGAPYTELCYGNGVQILLKQNAVVRYER